MAQGGKKKVAIAGAGVIGLAIALLLSEDEYEVTVVARNLPGYESAEWASPWAGALLAPHPDSGFVDLQKASLKVWQDLANNVPAAKKIKVTEYYDDRPKDAPIWYSSVVPNFRKIPSSELPADVKVGFTFDGLAVNPNDFLPWISDCLRKNGVKIIQRTLESLTELQELTGADILINASGAGAGSLANDETVTRVRGQTMFVKTPPEFFDEAMMRQGSEYTYVIPRASDGGCIIGGVRQVDNTQIEPDLSLKAGILRRVNEMTGGKFDWVDLEKDVARNIVGFRPGRKGGLRVERECNVVHAYGVDGLGYVYAFGIAERVKELVKGREARL
ncbi:Fc.00g020860.m01.CDS01 [Cosmosporella sp. VM-42]